MALLPVTELTVSSRLLRRLVAEGPPAMLPAARWLPVLAAAAGAGSGALRPAALVLRVKEPMVEPGVQAARGRPAVEVAQVHPAETELQLTLVMAEQEFHLLYQVQQ